MARLQAHKGNGVDKTATFAELARRAPPPAGLVPATAGVALGAGSVNEAARGEPARVIGVDHDKTSKPTLLKLATEIEGDYFAARQHADYLQRRLNGAQERERGLERSNSQLATALDMVAMRAARWKARADGTEI